MKKSIIFSVLTLGALLFCSCDDYLDVTPSDKQTADQLFATKSGFYTASNGIYDGLSSDALYGKHLTWEAIDLISSSYSSASANDYIKNLVANNYTEYTVSQTFSDIWQKAYELILAANLLIDQVDNQNGILTQQEADCLKGEMLAVRAYLHLDMMRLFGPSPYYGTDQTAIPYNESTKVTTLDLLTIDEACEKIIRDLDEAEKLLESDPIIENGPMMSEPKGSETVDLRYRQYRFNYYAVKALKARAYAWAGKTEEAYAQAVSLIQDKKAQDMFPAIDPNKLLANTQNPDRVFSSEVLMGIYDKDRDEVYNNYFSSSAPRNQHLQPYAGFVNDGDYGLFTNFMLGPEFEDYRFQSQWEAATGTGAKGHNFCKFAPIAKPDPTDEDSEYYFAKMIPLVKMQEMYLIAAECAPDAMEAVGWYNQVRTRRGLLDINEIGMTEDLAMYWDYGYAGFFLGNEYKREFWGEGQFFFFIKRFDCVGYGPGAFYYSESGAAEPDDVPMISVDVPLPAGEMR